MSDYFPTTSHDFKTNFSRYLKMLRQGRYDGIMVKHYKKPMGVFVLLEPPSTPLKEEPKTAPEAAQQSDSKMLEILQYLESKF